MRATLYYYSRGERIWRRLTEAQIERIGELRLGALADTSIPPKDAFKTWEWRQEDEEEPATR
jgi:hypothetical protein